MKIPDIPELHELRDFTVILPDGTIVDGEYPDTRFPDERPQRWRIKIYKKGRNIWPMVKARLEGIVSPEDLWHRIIALRNALDGKESK